MDDQLRRLKRAAKTGDIPAALQYFYDKQRSGPRTKLSYPPDLEVELQAGKLSGPLAIRALGAYHLTITSPWSTSERLVVAPFRVNGVLYRLDCAYYYYPDLGWTAHHPNAVEHARAHVRNAQNSTTFPRTIPVDQFLTRVWNNRESATCSTCASPEAGTTFNAARAGASVNRYQGPSNTAALALDALLRDTCANFVANYPEVIRASELVDINNQLIGLSPKVEEQRARLQSMEEQMAELVIKEAHLEDQSS